MPAALLAARPFMVSADARLSYLAGASDLIRTDLQDQGGVAGSTVVAPGNAALAQGLDQDATPLEAALLDLVNADRTANGLPTLHFDPALLPVARARAEAQTPLPALSH